jgi:hypothetical protein
LLRARLHLADRLVQRMRESRSVLPSSTQAAVLEHLASLFRRNQGALKFVILERLPAVLALCFEAQHQQQTGVVPAEHQQAPARQQQQHEKWAEDVRVGLFYVLVSKTGRLQKEHALVLCAHMLRYFGESWAVGPIPPLDSGTTLTRYYIIFIY